MKLSRIGGRESSQNGSSTDRGAVCVAGTRLTRSCLPGCGGGSCSSTPRQNAADRGRQRGQSRADRGCLCGRRDKQDRRRQAHRDGQVAPGPERAHSLELTGPAARQDSVRAARPSPLPPPESREFRNNSEETKEPLLSQEGFKNLGCRSTAPECEKAATPRPRGRSSGTRSTKKSSNGKVLVVSTTF